MWTSLIGSTLINKLQSAPISRPPRTGLTSTELARIRLHRVPFIILLIGRTFNNSNKLDRARKDRSATGGCPNTSMGATNTRECMELVSNRVSLLTLATRGGAPHRIRHGIGPLL